MNSRRKCPVCDSANSNPVYDNKLAPIGGHQFSNVITVCNECCFSFAERLADQEVYSEYYTNLSKYDVIGAAISPVDKLRVSAGVGLVSRFAGNEAKIVDIGCGNCALLGALKDQGYQRLIGIDQAKNCTERALIYGIEDVNRGSVVDFDLSLVGDADVVLVMAVLEHLLTPKSSIKRVVSGMKVGAKLIIEVPSLARFDGVNGEPFGEFSLEHLQFFSLTSLTNLAVGLNIKLVAHYDLDLPSSLGSLFAVFERTSEVFSELQDARSDAVSVKKYIDDSKAKLDLCLENLVDRSIILYGAGAHSGRLLPLLAQKQVHVRAIVDGNPNYQGETLGDLEIKDPAIISGMPDTPLLISSFRSESAIKAFCAERFANRIISFYENDT
ncbi:class I SAM-dependent methyltransferase [Porticoccaceae bacterium]|nr:class I SAM-dependent methyltransferase [Porticoccaceae bacterium]